MVRDYRKKILLYKSELYINCLFVVTFSHPLRLKRHLLRNQSKKTTLIKIIVSWQYVTCRDGNNIMGFSRNFSLRITIFRSHTPGILSYFSPAPPPPPLEFHTIFYFFSHPPGISRKTVILNYDPLKFSNFKHNPLEFSRFSFLRPPWNFRYPQQGRSRKFLEKPKYMLNKVALKKFHNSHEKLYRKMLY